MSLVHEGSPEDQPHIADTLDRRDFSAFQEHLKGFISIFNIPLEPRVRPVLFAALRYIHQRLLYYAASLSNKFKVVCSVNVSSLMGG